MGTYLSDLGHRSQQTAALVTDACTVNGNISFKVTVYLLTYKVTSRHDSASRESRRDHNIIMCVAALCRRRGWDGCVRVTCSINVLSVVVIT